MAMQGIAGMAGNLPPRRTTHFQLYGFREAQSTECWPTALLFARSALADSTLKNRQIVSGHWHITVRAHGCRRTMRLHLFTKFQFVRGRRIREAKRTSISAISGPGSQKLPQGAGTQPAAAQQAAQVPQIAFSVGPGLGRVPNVARSPAANPHPCDCTLMYECMYSTIQIHSTPMYSPFGMLC